MNHKTGTIVTVLLVIVVLGGIDLTLGHFLNMRDFNAFRTKHDYLHHTLLPDKDCLAMWGNRIYHVRTNSLGCRDATVRKVDVSRDVPRLLIMGDSHAEGVGIEYPNTAAGIIQDSLSKRGIDVINGSVASYSPKLYYLKTKYLMEEKKLPVTDLLVMIDISDLQNEIVYEKFVPRQSPVRKVLYAINRFFMSNSFIYRRSYVLVKRHQLKSFIRKSAYFREYARESPDRNLLPLYISFFDQFNDDQLVADPGFHSVQNWFYNDRYRPLAEKGLHLEMENIGKLKALCDSMNVRMTLSVHPWREQVLRSDTSDYYVNSWKSFCAKNHIRFINLYPAFIDPPSSAVFADNLFLPNDNHWSDYGNSLVAREVLKYYRGSDLHTPVSDQKGNAPPDHPASGQ